METETLEEPILVQSPPISFDGLLAPVSRREFTEHYRDRRHLFVLRDSPDYYAGLFDLADVDRWLSTAKQGGSRLTIVPAPGANRKAFEGSIAEIREEGIYARFEAGDTLRLLGIEDFWAEANTLVSSIYEALEVGAKINAYLTPASSQGFGVHFDYHDAFIVQVSGSKDWFIYNQGYEKPMDADFARNRPATPESEEALTLVEQATLSQGDLLYIPRGFYHKAVTRDQHSLHLTVSLRPVYWADVLKRAIEMVSLEEVRLRETLPQGLLSSSERRHEAARDLESLLRLVCERVSSDKVLSSVAAGSLKDRAFPPDGHFVSLVNNSKLRLPSLVQRRAGLICRTQLEDGMAALQFGDHAVTGPAEIFPALEFIQNHESFRVEQLPAALTDKSKLVLTRRLVREGMLKIVEL